MVRTSCEANLVANVDEVGSEAKLSHGAEGDEQEKIWVISRLEGSHLGGRRTVSGRTPQVRKFYEDVLHVEYMRDDVDAIDGKDNSVRKSGWDDGGRVPNVPLFNNADNRPGRRRQRCQPMASPSCPP